MKNLIKDIKAKLNIEGGFYIDAEIESNLEGVSPDNYLEFFKSLSGNEYSYKNAMDRISIVASKFKQAEADTLFKGTQTLAKEVYTRLYGVNCSMTTYSQTNRDVIKDDRVFFETMDYKNMVDVHGKSVLTEQDIYILKELGGGEWLMNIKFITNSKDAEAKIEGIIKNAITEKYMRIDKNSISNKVQNLIKR